MKNIEIIGNKIWFDGYHVGNLKENLPSMVDKDFRKTVTNANISRHQRHNT